MQCLPRIQDTTHTYQVHSSYIFCCTFPEEVDSKRLRTNKLPALPIIVSHQKLTRELTFRCFFFVLWVRYFSSDCMILLAQLTTPLQPLWMLLIEKTSFLPFRHKNPDGKILRPFSSKKIALKTNATSSPFQLIWSVWGRESALGPGSGRECRIWNTDKNKLSNTKREKHNTVYEIDNKEC